MVRETVYRVYLKHPSIRAAINTYKNIFIWYLSFWCEFNLPAALTVWHGWHPGCILTGGGVQLRRE
jgi:hypothetical protein